jgi:phosphate transport system protein
MFKQLLSALRKGDLVNQALHDTEDMLSKAQRLYNEATAVILENRTPKFDIYKLDREINNIEKDVRRKVLEHLSINPRQEIAATLVLTSIIIDIERIGDYSKNIFELINLHRGKKKGFTDEKLNHDVAFLSGMFEEVKSAFSSGDAKEAALVMNKLNPVKKEFDTYISKLATKRGLSTRKTVVNVLFSRYLKRVCAHLENIVSGIANPFDMIGFYKENMNKEAD